MAFRLSRSIESRENCSSYLSVLENSSSSLVKKKRRLYRFVSASVTASLPSFAFFLCNSAVFFCTSSFNVSFHVDILLWRVISVITCPAKLERRRMKLILFSSKVSCMGCPQLMTPIILLPLLIGVESREVTPTLRQTALEHLSSHVTSGIYI